jgi:hypothetical protein
MSTINAQIMSKLGACPEDVQRLAARALELSTDNSEAAVFEALKNWVRQIVRDEGEGS